jgi:hypothetical protein
MKHKIALLMTALICLGGSCARGIRPDQAIAAIAAGDYTALIEGCGNQLVSGYTYCRKVDGVSTDELLYFVAPATECLSKTSCVSFKVFNPDGSVAFGGEVPRGTTRVAIKWSDLTKKPVFTNQDRGFWQFIYDIKWLDLDGNERMTRSLGEIRLRVLPKTYLPLNEVSSDPNFVWQWSENGVVVKMTTGARTYVGKKQ